MTRRFAMLQTVTLALALVVGTTARADVLLPQTAYFEVHKLDLWPTRYFTLLESNGAHTFAQADSSLVSGYTFFNDSYTSFLQAEKAWADGDTYFAMATDPVYRFFAGVSVLQVTDKTNAPVGRVQRHRLTLHKAKFTLHNAKGDVFAEATLNRKADVMLVVDAAQPMRALARLDRILVAASDRSPAEDFWAVQIYDTETLPHDMVRVLATYISDYQDWFAWSSFNLGPKEVTNSVRNRIVELGTETVVKSALSRAVGRVPVVVGNVTVPVP